MRAGKVVVVLLQLSWQSVWLLTSRSQVQTLLGEFLLLLTPVNLFHNYTVLAVIQRPRCVLQQMKQSMCCRSLYLIHSHIFDSSCLSSSSANLILYIFNDDQQIKDEYNKQNKDIYTTVPKKEGLHKYRSSNRKEIQMKHSMRIKI